MNKEIRIVIGADHKGVDLKEAAVEMLREWGLQVEDVGTMSRESCDYSDYANAVCKREVDVRGMALPEALEEVNKFLDDAVISSLGEVSIIHGVGTGVLRQGIADCLKRHPSVASFRPGRYGEGEAGVTVVTLR